ncbi:hypothetical protein UFOVP411_14 [uncultured Caudovirales phage]|uniref:Uncharacterized protein n=1 Tax=uncultured Caudovirales phage TaxID=2100421 RepID=A0A6J5M7A2_9CAUD|nr:hypothetical protein UFOVP411_14 [uncultured Caudovirales phage]
MKKYAQRPKDGKAKSGAPFGKQNTKDQSLTFSGSAPGYRKAPGGVPSTPTTGTNLSKRNVSNVK